MAVLTDYGRRDALCAWLTENGIDPHDVPIDADLTIVDTDGGRVIRCEVEVRGEGGGFLVDERGDRSAREMRTVPLKTEPPVWWTPYEKPTREQLLAAAFRVREVIADMRMITGARTWADWIEDALNPQEQPDAATLRRFKTLEREAQQILAEQPAEDREQRHQRIASALTREAQQAAEEQPGA